MTLFRGHPKQLQTPAEGTLQECPRAPRLEGPDSLPNGTRKARRTQLPSGSPGPPAEHTPAFLQPRKG